MTSSRHSLFGPCFVWFGLLAFCLAGQAQEPSTPAENPLQTTLKAVFDRLEQGDALEHRYTYAVYRRTQTTDDKGLSGHLSEEYELTWIGDLPYLRLRALHGASLTGRDLQKEQELYDKFVAEHKRLGVAERINLQGGHGVECPTHPELALTDSYSLHDIGTDKTPEGVKHVIVALPEEFTPNPGECRWRYMFWFDDATLTLSHLRADTPGDTSTLCEGARNDQWFRVVDGFPRRFHTEVHFYFLKKKSRFTMDFEDSYTDFRRFRSTVKLGEAKEVPPEDTPPK